MSQLNIKAGRILGSKVLLGAVAFVLIGLIVSLGRESYRKYRLDKEISGLKSQIESLEGSNGELAGLMDYFRQGSYLEKEARIKFNLKKPDEKVVILSDNVSIQSYSKPISGLASSSVKKMDNIANYWKWWEYFFSS